MDSAGEKLELGISTVAYRGAGISRDGGIVTFVPRTLPGERVIAEISEVRKNFKIARALEIVEASPDRIESQCLLPDGTPVPGCAYDFASHSAEVAIKQGQLRDFLRKVSDPSTEFLPPAVSPRELNYRNKTTFHVTSQRGKTVAGYCLDGSRTVVDIERCPLSSDGINKAWVELGARLRASHPQCRTVTLRETACDGVSAWSDISQPPVARLVEESPVGRLSVPADGFFQVNPPVAAALVDCVKGWIAEVSAAHPLDMALDLCCGVGVFAIAAAQAGIPRAIGVETARPSVKCARANAEALGLRSCIFHCRDMAEFLSDASQCPADLSVAIAVIDPPRSGIPPAALDMLCASKLRHAIFVSCDPATLARDLAITTQAGFRIRKAGLFDMFPRTIHFESAILLERTTI